MCWRLTRCDQHWNIDGPAVSVGSRVQGQLASPEVIYTCHITIQCQVLYLLLLEAQFYWFLGIHIQICYSTSALYLIFITSLNRGRGAPSSQPTTQGRRTCRRAPVPALLAQWTALLTPQLHLARVKTRPISMSIVGWWDPRKEAEQATQLGKSHRHQPLILQPCIKHGNIAKNLCCPYSGYCDSCNKDGNVTNSIWVNHGQRVQ